LNEVSALHQAANVLVERAAKAGQRGTLADPDELRQLDHDLGGRLPGWYAELLASVPLGGLELGWQAGEPEDDFDGVEWLDWSSPHDIRGESVEVYPGIAILERGYINVATDPTGGGNPYFIPTDQGDDPPLFQVYHDVSDDPDTIVRDARQLVAGSLSEFFAQAVITPMPARQCCP
jgi:hypothetical protein